MRLGISVLTALLLSFSSGALVAPTVAVAQGSVDTDAIAEARARLAEVLEGSVERLTERQQAIGQQIRTEQDAQRIFEQQLEELRLVAGSLAPDGEFIESLQILRDDAATRAEELAGSNEPALQEVAATLQGRSEEFSRRIDEAGQLYSDFQIAIEDLERRQTLAVALIQAEAFERAAQEVAAFLAEVRSVYDAATTYESALGGQGGEPLP